MSREREAEVVVAGLGAAGCAAAITAHDEGASVLVVEKQAEPTHRPNLRLSGGYLMVCQDVDGGSAYLDACAQGLIPSDVSAAWAHGATELEDWVAATTGLAASVFAPAEFEEFPGAASVTVKQVRYEEAGYPSGGQALYAKLRAALAQREIPILWEHALTTLAKDVTGRVNGLDVRGPGGETARIRSRNGVVLSAGGFGNDDGAKRNFLSVYPAHFYGSPENQGDGLRAAQAVGAGLWHMNRMSGRGVMSFERTDGSRSTFMPRIEPGKGGYLIVDGQGQRFANEELQAAQGHAFYYELAYYDVAARRYPRVPSFWVFDHRRLETGPLAFTDRGLAAIGDERWSEDNRLELDQGWIVEAESIEELAARLEIGDAEALVATVEAYGKACASGEDSQGRSAPSLEPFAGPPYYAVALWPGGSHTFGGPVRDASARILGPLGDPIPGLYGAGELGAPIGALYPAAGAALSEAISFGRIAGRHAAAWA